VPSLLFPSLQAAKKDFVTALVRDQGFPEVSQQNNLPSKNDLCAL
jgi:hypothetical protein